MEKNGMRSLGTEEGQGELPHFVEMRHNHCGNLAFCTKTRLTNHQAKDMRMFKQLSCYGAHVYLIKWSREAGERQAHKPREGNLSGRQRQCLGGSCLMNSFPCDQSQSCFRYFCVHVILHNKKRFYNEYVWTADQVICLQPYTVNRQKSQMTI